MHEQQIFHLLTQEYSLILASTQEHILAVQKIRKEVVLPKYQKFATIKNEDAFLYNEDDKQSFIYLLQHNASKNYVGTIRVFFINHTTPIQKMPMQKDGQVNDIGEFTKNLPLCEVSRLALANDLPNYQDLSGLRLRTYLTMGLMSAIGINISLYKYRTIFSVMDPSLHRILKRQGVDFKVVGQPVDYYGIGIPYAIEREKLMQESSAILAQVILFYLKELAHNREDFWQIIDKNPYLNRSDLQLETIIKLIHIQGKNLKLTDFR